jgi:hypothetical protein
MHSTLPRVLLSCERDGVSENEASNAAYSGLYFLVVSPLAGAIDALCCVAGEMHVAAVMRDTGFSAVAAVTGLVV